MLDAEGRMIGSMMLAEFPDQAALEAAIAADPYVVGQVWQDIEIKPFRVAPL
mgnify:CR=1 FL=1